LVPLAPWQASPKNKKNWLGWVGWGGLGGGKDRYSTISSTNIHPNRFSFCTVSEKHPHA